MNYKPRREHKEEEKEAPMFYPQGDLKNSKILDFTVEDEYYSW